MPEASTGLDKIYVIYQVKNVDLVYTCDNPSSVRIYTYSNLGGGFAEEVQDAIYQSGNVIVKNIVGDRGYIIEDGSKRYCYWVVDYFTHRFEVSSVEVDSESDCDAVLLNVSGKGDAIHYFTVNGQQKTLNREISVDFDTQEWSESNIAFETIASSKSFEYLSQPLRISPPPLCSTSFKVSGDKFLRQWDWLSEAESTVFAPLAVAVKTTANQEGSISDSSGNGSEDSAEGTDNPENTEDTDNNDEPTPSNQIKTDGDGLGGSAPADITFNAYTSEGVIHHEWQLTTDPNFEDIEYRFNQQDINYTFTQEGTYYMRYIGSNYDGSCDAYGEVYTIKIGASELKCPNAFSPDGDGINDEWKVAYRSLLSFKCWIFDRFGQQIYYFDNPDLGWDGTRGGKPVGTGVYYYVIEAEGSDGTKYKKGGDINILRHRTGTSTSGSGNSESEGN